jgi:hypothetical protein
MPFILPLFILLPAEGEDEHAASRSVPRAKSVRETFFRGEDEKNN